MKLTVHTSISITFIVKLLALKGKLKTLKDPSEVTVYYLELYINICLFVMNKKTKLALPNA